MVCAIVLKSVPYKESDKIVILFTLEKGKVTAYLRGKKTAWMEPFTAFSASLEKNKGSLFQLKDPKLMEGHFHLRKNMASLQSAQYIIRFLENFLAEETPTPPLFQLLLVYLEKLEVAKNPLNFAASFLLKSLALEGHLGVDKDGIHLLSTTLSLDFLPLLTSRQSATIDAFNKEVSFILQQMISSDRL